MAARSYMVLMDLFTVCEKGREERERERGGVSTAGTG